MLPPYGRLTIITLSDRQKSIVRQHSFMCFDKLPRTEALTAFGPMEAYLSPLRGQYRYQILLKYPKNFHIQPVLKQWALMSKHPSVRIHIDIDPL
jgi:primosomal protein N'